MIDLKPACHRMVEVLQRVTDDQLTSSSPCAEYTVADLIDHVDLVSRGSAALARRDSGELPDTGGADSSPGWRDGVARHVLALGEAWDEPAAWQGRTDVAGLELSNEVWGKIALTELVVHGWDIAKATGQPFDLPEHTVRACFDHVTEFVPVAPVPALWGPPVAVGPDATLLDQIVAITGRVP
ncbi:TIGR03086 family metal-binding protein [Lentzea sp. NEAU-D7]|uniref:TIGR03086 family metal-binding protein n=1 Tax=Lentzea sp. NEAU-D7 TaxID=2994667 RepID=UPI00224B3C65|nr:TIGR03086 family metal-binding protein [Lentzea sp. NEAU-D7]MCX2955322.1 TIGR03086 family metal-binding protein [Lentzea sp. NEAU-D7]